MTDYERLLSRVRPPEEIHVIIESGCVCGRFTIRTHSDDYLNTTSFADPCAVRDGTRPDGTHCNE